MLSKYITDMPYIEERIFSSYHLNKYEPYHNSSYFKILLAITDTNYGKWARLGKGVKIWYHDGNDFMLMLWPKLYT